MTQNQEKIANNFHGKRVMYGGFALVDHSLLLLTISGQPRTVTSSYKYGAPKKDEKANPF